MTLRQSLTSLAGAAGLMLLVPFVMLAVGLPVVLVIRAVLEIVGWLLATMF